jgi:tetratricopeptide (TPR) repeat protein
MPRATYSVASHVPWDRSEALEAARQALELHPTGDRNRWASLTDTGDVLRTRFRELGDLDLLTSAIDLFREALILRPRGHHDRSLSLEHLAEALWARCEQISDLDILAEAIELHREALDLRPPGHPHRPWSLNNLAIALQTRFEQLGELGALADAVDLHRQALDLRPPGHPDRPQSLNNLALSLWTQFEQLGDQDSLAEAVELHRQALDLRPPGHPDHSQTLNNLANALRTRFAQLGDQDSLAEAVELHRQALQLRPPGHPERSQSLNNLAGALQTRFEQLGDLNSLAEAVELHRQALDLRSLGHPGRSMSLSNLALSLHMRFNQLGDLDTLAEAVELHRQALDLRPQGHPDRLQSLNNLAIALKTRFEQLGDLDSLAEAVKLHHQALDVHPLGHPDRWYSLNSLANAMKARFHRLGDVESLANAVEMHRQALGLCPPGHPLRILSLHNLGCTLKTQSQRRKGINHAPRVQCSTQRGLPDVDEELGLYKEALRSCVSGHPLRIRLLFDIGTCLLRTGTHVHNFDEGMCYILEGLRDPASSAREAVGHAIDALPMIEVAYRLSTEQTDTVELLGHHRRELILEAYTLVIRYLPRVASLGLDHAGRFRELSGAEKISRNAAMRAIYSGRNADAIEMLEEGRGVFWSQALRLRTTDLDQLPTEDAQELRRFFRMLETGSARDESNNKLQREQHTEDRRRLSNVADSLIADIRSRPGMSRFLLPPSFSLLVQSLPETGSVVVLLTSDLGHRALVLDRATGLTASLELLPPKCGFLPEAVRVSLPRDGNARMEDNNVSRLVGFSGRAKQMPKEHLDQTRAQLWALIVKPVIDVLGLKVCSCCIIRS